MGLPMLPKRPLDKGHGAQEGHHGGQYAEGDRYGDIESAL